MLCYTKRVVDNVQSLNISEAVILFLDAYIIISESLRLVELILGWDISNEILEKSMMLFVKPTEM